MLLFWPPANRSNGRERKGLSGGLDCAEVVPDVPEAKAQFLSVKFGDQLEIFHRLRWSASSNEESRRFVHAEEDHTEYGH